MMCFESEHYVRLENLKILSLQVECIMNVLENFSRQRHSSSFNWLLEEEYDFDSSLKMAIFTSQVLFQQFFFEGLVLSSSGLHNKRID